MVPETCAEFKKGIRNEFGGCHQTWMRKESGLCHQTCMRNAYVRRSDADRFDDGNPVGSGFGRRHHMGRKDLHVRPHLT